MTVLALVLASFVLAQATPPPTAGDPVPGVPNTAKTAPTDPIPGVPPTPSPRPPAEKTKPSACTPTATKPCPPPDVPVKL
jgi:hypothetical protein